jgi:hypothetical protein
MTRLKSLCRGDEPLAVAFWNWAVLGGLLVNLTAHLLFFALLMNEHPITGFLVGHALSMPYNIVAAVAVWRSAERYPGPRCWANLARVVTVVGMVLLSIA